MSQNKSSQREVIGLFPAGGQATRIAPLPGSKELYPIGFRPVDEGRSLRPKVVCHYLLEKMRLAGVRKVYIVLREGKWDIPAYLGDGSLLDMHLAYLMMGLPFGAPYTIDQAYPFVQEALVAFGFPDVLFQPDDAFVQLLARQAETQADIVLGLFPSDQPHTADMVDFDDAGQVRHIHIKPAQTDLTYTWMIAVWTPVFTQFMHDHLANVVTQASGQKELFVGDVIQAALLQGLPVQTVLFPGGKCLDIGLPENLVKAVRNFTSLT
jgi:glucose-1-phosphate thymidylyltransferase